MTEEKSMSNTNMDDLAETSPDVMVHGEPGKWVCVCKASSEKQGWMKSTKVMELPTWNVRPIGCLVQVSTQVKDNVAEAVCWIPGVTLEDFLSEDEDIEDEEDEDEDDEDEEDEEDQEDED